MTAIEITPAGNRLFEVTIEDDRGTSRHEVAVPDGMVEEVLGDAASDVSLQDVVLASLDWRLEHEDRQDFPTSFSLEELRGAADFDQEIPRRALARASGDSTHGQHTDDRRGGDKHERLVEETREAQAEGQASSPRRYD